MPFARAFIFSARRIGHVLRFGNGRQKLAFPGLGWIK